MEVKEHKFYPISVQKRKVTDHKQFEIESRYVILEIWDNAQVDGDTISLNFNGKWILKNHGLAKGKERLFIKLEEGKENEIIFFAKNVGSIPPNTTSITLIDGIVRTPASSATSLAATLLPNLLSINGDGPIKIILFFSHSSAKSGFSDKKPYPG